MVPPEPAHAEEIGRICFDAFRAIQEGRQDPLDWTDVAIAREVLGMLSRHQRFYSVVALIDGRPVGSNFLSLLDPVSGLGPISVDPLHQGEGIGRRLMQDVLDAARQRGIQRVRLLQDSFNPRSLSLYASLGFDVQEPIAVVQSFRGAEPDAAVRPIANKDFEDVERLSTRIYKTSRRNDVTDGLEHGNSTFVRERSGSVSGYLTPGLDGHGVAESVDDMVALIGEAARRLGPDGSPVLVPLREGDLYREVLAKGGRTIKVMNLMSLGVYDPPDGVWMPSIYY